MFIVGQWPWGQINSGVGGFFIEANQFSAPATFYSGSGEGRLFRGRYNAQEHGNIRMSQSEGDA